MTLTERESIFEFEIYEPNTKEIFFVSYNDKII